MQLICVLALQGGALGEFLQHLIPELLLCCKEVIASCLDLSFLLSASVPFPILGPPHAADMTDDHVQVSERSRSIAYDAIVAAGQRTQEPTTVRPSFAA